MPVLSLLAAALLALAGCETTQLAEPAKSAVPVETRSPVAAGGSTAPGATASATPASRVATVDLANPPGAPGAAAAGGTAAAGSTAMMALPAERVVYFDFDSFVIKDDYKPVLDGYARALQGDRKKRLVVEGHTDERGGREYNLALGQKRAEAVVKTLTLLGATDSQLEAVSFGEERPAVQGSDEAAWAKNRRAELKSR
jgi:peptidoglycan-associated lipoprotein